MGHAPVAALVLTSVVALGFAQDEPPQPKKYADVTWYEIVHVDYAADQAEQALEMIHERFIPAAREAELPRARVLEYATGGAWDVTLIFEMHGGPGDMEWEIHPNNVKWMAALAAQEGSPEAARELLSEYRSMIDRFEVQIVRERNH